MQMHTAQSPLEVHGLSADRAPRRTPILAPLSALGARLADACRARLPTRSTAVADLDDRALRDIGITPDSVRRAARDLRGWRAAQYYL